MWRALCVLASFLVACGCSEKTEESLAKRTGNTVTEAITDFASGVGETVDKRLLVEVDLSEEMAELGFSKTVAKSFRFDQPLPEQSGNQTLDKGISVYLISESAYEGRLIAKAWDQDGLEIGRSVVDAKFDADDAKYIRFAFEDDVDMQLVQRFTIDIRKGSSKKATDEAEQGV